MEDLFSVPLKQRFEVKNRISPVLVKKMLLQTTDSDSNQSTEIGNSDSQNYFEVNDMVLHKFYEGVQKENRLIFEQVHFLSSTVQCSTGFCVTFGIIPVVKLSLTNTIFPSQYGCIVNFIYAEWKEFLGLLEGSVKKFLLSEEEEQLDVSFSNFRITSDRFFHEKVIRVLWHDKGGLYMTKGEVLRLLDLANILEKRMESLSHLTLSEAYYNLLALVNEILHSYEKTDRVEAVPVELVTRVASCCGGVIELLFSEMLLYFDKRILSDINQMRCIY